MKPSEQPAPIKKPASDSLRLRYASNPYRNTMRGLGVMFQANPVSSLSVTPLLILLGLVLIVPGAILVNITEVVGGLLLAIGALVWTTVMVAAILAIQSASYHGKTVSGKQAFRSINKKRLPALFGLILLSYLIVGLGFVLLIIPGLIALGRLSLAAYAFHDEHRGVLSSLKRSWQLTRGHTWELLGTFVSQMLIIGSSGGLLSIVGSSAGLADRYYTLKAHEKAKVETGPTHYANYLNVLLSVLAIVIYIGFLAVLAKTTNDAVNELPGMQTQQLQNDPFMNDSFDGLEGVPEGFDPYEMQ